MSEEKPEQPQVGMRFYGSRPLDGAVDAAVHFKALMHALTEEIVGPDSGIAWQFASMRWVCDGCDADRPNDGAGWVNDGTYDWCPACAPTREPLTNRDPSDESSAA